MVLRGFCFMKESARHSAGHRRKWLTNWQYRWNCLWNFLLHEKVCSVCGPLDWWLVPIMLQKNFEWLWRQWDVSVNSKVLDISYHARVCLLRYTLRWHCSVRGLSSFLVVTIRRVEHDPSCFYENWEERGKWVVIVHLTENWFWSRWANVSFVVKIFQRIDAWRIHIL